MKLATLAVYALACLSAIPSFAQEKKDTEKEVSSPKIISLGLGAGSQGIGLDATMKLHPHWYVRLGGSYLPFDYSGAIKIDAYNTNMHIVTGFTNIHLLAEWQPWKSWIRLVGGLSYFTSADVKGTLTLKNTQYYGDIAIQPADVGEINAKISWQGLAPYLGINLLKAQPTNKINVNIDLGSYYWLSQDVSMSGTKLLVGNNANTAQLKENLNAYRWLPVLQLNLNYKISK